MARRAKKKNVKSASKNELFINSFRVLSFVGKPFYLIFSSIVEIVVFLLFIIGRTFRKSLEVLEKKAKESIKKSKKAKPKKEQNYKLKVVSRVLVLKLYLFKEFVSSKIKLPKRQKKVQIAKTYKKRLKKRYLIPLTTLTLFLGLFYYFILKDLPSSSELVDRPQEVSTKIYDRNRVLLYKIFKDKNRTIIKLSDIPSHVKLATLAAEDAEFYNHPGFSVKGIVRALIQDAKQGTLQGGSTITQQLVKNVLLSSEKTVIRKIKELVLSIEVETNYTKDQILEMYLNEVSYGGTAYGIEEASETYFGKNVNQLTIAEAALLAGLPKSPTYYSPFGSNPHLAVERQKEVLNLMKVNKYITEDQKKEALREKIVFAPNKTEIKAPHFVMYVRQILVDKYGEDVVEKGGLEVTTSLDAKIQEISEGIVKSEIEKLKNLNVGNGAAIVMSPKNGEILAMVGSKDYFDIDRDGQVNVATRLRQPGSSIKLVNYAYALGHGYSPASIIDDSRITYVLPGSAPYSPKNYDGQFKGKVTLRTALAESRNIPAVKVLASYGVDAMVEQGKAMGITSWEDSSNYGLSLTLGGGAVTMIDLTKVYANIANYGKTPNLNPILEVKDYKGKILQKSSCHYQNTNCLGPVVTDPRVSYMLIDILKDNLARAPEFGLNSYLVIKNHPEVAVKTGTSNDLRDNWTVGFNQNYLVAAWVGNNDNSPMRRIASGLTGASPIWNKIMSVVLSEEPSIDWSIPNGLAKVNICTLTATLPCNGCPTRQEWFLEELTPKRACNENQINPPPTPIPTPKLPDILDSGIRSQRRGPR